MVDLTPILEALIALVGAAITVFLIPWLKTKMTNEQFAKVQAFVQTGVFAAEKLYGAGNGDKKLKYVEDFLQTKKIKLDTKTLKAMVDAEVKKLELVDPDSAFKAMDNVLFDDVEDEEEEEDDTAKKTEVMNNGA